jgi:intein/homing endonuclease
MGQAVAERTILRKKADGKWETWDDVSHRVALGNSLLCRTEEEQKQEYKILYKHLSKASILMSGRHLQHGDETQPERPYEVFVNCATSFTSFSLFYLLMNGSGIGRSYDDDIMIVNWDNAPTIRCVIDESHPDYDYSAHESVRDAKHKYESGKDTLWHVVEDTREGWAKALEIWENAAFEKIHKDKLLILDFSKVRAKGSPIKGMQNRPASGPVPLMNAFYKALTLKGAGLSSFMQTMYIDHYFAECVLVGGARRAARMSTKLWKDQTIFDFITIKRPIEYYDKTVEEIIELRTSLTNKPNGFLWSSNNSVMVDKEFWSYIDMKRNDPKYHSLLAKHARKVFKLITSAAYGDSTGEPGLINVDKLVENIKGLECLNNGDLVGSKKYQVNDDTNLYLNRLFKKAIKKQYHMICNPCVTADTWVQTHDGPRQVADLINKPFEAMVNGKPYCALGFWKTGHKPVYLIKTNRGYILKATDNHPLLVEKNKRSKLHGGYNYEHLWVEVKDLKIGDHLVLANQRNVVWSGNGNFEAGWLIGEIIGDGGHNPEKYHTYLRFWGKNKDHMVNIALKYIEASGLKIKSNLKGYKLNEVNDSRTVGCVALNELAEPLLEPLTKNLLKCVETMSSDFYRGLLSGLFDADGTVCKNKNKGIGVRLSQCNLPRLHIVQRMLARLGIISSIYRDRKEAGYNKMPDGNGGEKLYWCQPMHELHISKDNLVLFADLVGFKDPDKAVSLHTAINSIERGIYKESFVTKIESIEYIGDEDVYDCSVEVAHEFDANGIRAHNCGEIKIALWGAYCCIGDLVPFHSDTIEEAEEAFRAVARALIRVNTMDALYKKELKRTNRIGVGITGIHEFAWKFFKLGFKDLIDEEKSKDFWMVLSRFKRAVQDESEKYSNKYGLEIPHSDSTIKPSGTVSKLFGLTEGWHLPSMLWYMRWVQFSNNDPLIQAYKKAGYPIKELKKYQNTTIVGFPTTPIICELGMGNKLVTAGEATPEEQYKWIMLGEKYWLHGVDVDGKLLKKDTSNQISYTLKYLPTKVSYKDFIKTIQEYQPLVKCCSVMPQEEKSSYEYLPEQPVTKAEYEDTINKIKQILEEDVDLVHVDCAGGACPIEFRKAV